MMGAVFLGALLALIAAPAFAGPVATAISAIVGAFSSSAVLMVLGRVLLFTAIAAYQKRRMKKAMQRQQGIKTQYTNVGGVTPLSVIVGRYATAGQLEAPQASQPANSSPPQKYLTYVIGLSDMPITGLTGRVVINDSWHSFSETPTSGLEDYGMTVEGDLADVCWFRLNDGTQTAADPFLIGKFGADPERPWTADMIGRGIAHVVATFKRDQEKLPGEPRLRFEVLGLKLYDPRKDSTVGGTGAHRWADPATWEFSANPKVIEYNILRGLRIDGYGVWGGNATAAALPLDNWFAAMNACDLPVDDGNGGVEPAFEFGFEFGLDQEPAEIIDEINRSCNGETVEVAGVYKTRVGAIGLPVFFFEDGDVIVSRPRELEPFQSLDQTFNALTCSFPDPDVLWEAREAPPLTNPAWEEEDGLIAWDEATGQFIVQPRRLLREISLPGVANPRQVQRIMATEAAKSRRQKTHGLTLPPQGLTLEPLDAVAWSSAHNGYANKVFEVVMVADPVQELRPRVGLLEADPNDDTPPDYLPLPAPSTLDGGLAGAMVTGFSVAAVALLDATGTPRRADLQITWNGAEAAELRAIFWEVRIKATGAQVNAGTTQATAAGAQRVVGLLPATEFEVRLTPITDRPAIPTAWLTVTTPDARLTGADLDQSIQNSLAGAEQAAIDAANALQTAQDIQNTVAQDTNTAITTANQILADVTTLKDQTEAARLAAQAAETGAQDVLTQTTAARDTTLAYRDAAQAAKTASETARTQAQTAATNASGSASAAAGSASSASTSAGDAATSAGNAQNSATAAAASSVSAQSSSDSSLASLAAVQSAINSARLMAPSVPSKDISAFGANLNGTLTSYIALAASEYGSDADGAWARRNMTSSNVSLSVRALLPVGADKVYKVSAKLKSEVANSFRLRASYVNASGAVVASQEFATKAFVANTIDTISIVVGAASGGLVTNAANANWTNTAYSVRFSLRNVNAASGSYFYLHEFQIEDYSQADAAARSASQASGSASAAATSASAASTSATDASQSAAAATTAKTAAETARSGAEAARDTAVTAKNDAQSASSTATTQAGIATTARTDAQNAATAASGSASTAATEASNAAQSASAADTAKTAAQTARSGAESARDTAVTAKNDAQSAASTATTQAGIATTAKTDAQNAATAASTSASTAASEATNASQSAAAADTAKTAAQTAKSAAEAARDTTITARNDAQSAASTATTQASIATTATTQTQVAISATDTIISLPVSEAAAFGFTTLGLVSSYAALQAGNAAYGSDANGPYVRRTTDALGSAVFLRSLASAANSDAVYRVTIRVKPSVSMQLRFHFAFLDNAGASLLSGVALPETVPAGAIYTKTIIFGRRSGGLVTTVLGNATVWGNAIGIRFGLSNGEIKAGAYYDIYEIKIEDLTEADEAKRQADAAASSASASSSSATAAASSATDASQSASLAQTERANAQTARAAAEAARDTAITARDDAQGSASSAQSAFTLSSRVVGQGNGVLTSQFIEGGWTTFTTAPVYAANSKFPVGQEATWNLAAGVQGGFMLPSSNAAWVGAKDANAYYVEIDYTLNSGSLASAGILFDWGNTGGTNYRVTKNLTEMTPQVIVSGRVMTARAVVEKPANFTGTFLQNRIYLMAAYSLISATLPGVNITVHRIYIRQATDEERGQGAVIANLSQTFRTSAQVDSAISAGITNFNASVAGGLTSTVSLIALAVANLEGFVAATASLTAELSNGKISGIRATVYDGEGGATSGSLLELIGDDVIAEGTISTSRLNVGLGLNHVYDSDYRAGADAWGLFKSGGSGAETTLSMRPEGSTWSGSWFKVLQFFQSGSSTDGVAKAYNAAIQSNGTTTNMIMPVSAGDWIEASAKVSAHRCTGEVRIQWLTSAGASNGETVAGNIANVTSSNTNPNDWPRYGGKAQAPANTAYCRIVIQKNGTTSGTNSYMFIHQPMLAKTTAASTELTPYSPSGATTIHGGSLISQTITADRLNAASLGVAGLSIFGGELKSSNFVQGASGWRIKSNGDAEFANLVARGWLQNGSVSDIFEASITGPNNYTADGEILKINTGPTTTDLVFQGLCYCEFVRNPTLSAGNISLRYRKKEGGVWSAYTEGKSLGSLASWRVFDYAQLLPGGFEDIEWSLYLDWGNGGIDIRNVKMVLRAVTK